MAFNITFMGRVSTSANTEALMFWTYNGLADGANDTLAEIVASGYFNDFMQNLATGNGPLQVGDLIAVHGSDASGLYTVTAITTNVTLAVFTANGPVPAAIVAYLAQVTTSSGVVGSTHVVTIAGALATDLAFVQVVNNGTADVTVIQAVVTADTLTVTFSAAPGADVVYNYQLLRAS